MPRTCTVCSHDEGHQINVALVKSGSSNRRIAAQYGLSENAIRAHRAKHLPELLVKASRAVEVGNADDLLAEVEALWREAKDVLERHRDDDDPRWVLAAIDRASRQLELLGRLRGELNEAAINLHVHPEWVELKTVIVGALEPHPEARQAILAALASRREVTDGSA